ncbi:MAG: endolytic transglycosylase MltG [Candidatus Kapabacteria bacterium]|nr:endolytic transglycosylase MltG [Candidatus Kapabacteria bacterium]
MKPLRILLSILALMLLCGGLAIVFYLLQPLPVATTTDVFIPQNSSVRVASARIRSARIVRFPSLFQLSLRLAATLSGRPVYAGSYRFTPENNHLDVYRSLLSGKQSLTVRVTFPEGITLWRFASILRQNIGIDSAEFIRLASDDSVCRAFGVQQTSLEGYLMPDTYEFFWKQPEESVLQTVVNASNTIWQERFAAQASSKGKTRHEVLTLASIVEAETPQPDERARVAGVYQNRLNKGMKLDADPTVQFALGGEARRLYYNDLDVNSPYNTYRNTGLPPGPINSPSVASIAAALEPETNTYIYFCAKGDGSNTHSFATTSADHQLNVLRYRKNRTNAQK